jgi:hypothetical protein
MAILWADFPSGQLGLYGLSEVAMLAGIWAEIEDGGTGDADLASDPDTNIGSSGTVFKTTGVASFPAFGRMVLPGGAQATVGVGFRLWQSILPIGNGSNGNATLWFTTAANAIVCYVKVLSDGGIGVYNSANTLLGSTTIPAVTAAAYSHIEAKVLRDAAAGTVEVRVNGTSVLNLTGLALGASNIGQIRIGSFQSTSNLAEPSNYIKDLVVWDSTGSEGNDFQGSVAVHDLYTDADISLNWTPSTGSTGWDLLDKTAVDDTTYIGAASSAVSPYVASLTNLPDDVTSIRALLPIYRAAKTDGGDCNIQAGLTPNNVDWDDGADRAMTTSYTYWWDVSHLSPDTSAPWTPVEVNAAYVRVDRTL